jgi:hypothetical protein
VWPDGRLPDDALTEGQLIAALKINAIERWRALLPRDAATLENYKSAMGPAWRHTLQLGSPGVAIQTATKTARSETDGTMTEFEVTRDGESNHISVVSFVPTNPAARAAIVVLADASSGATWCDAPGKPAGLARRLLGQGHAVWVVREFSASPSADPFANFFTTYNRTLSQVRVRDLVTLAAAARSFDSGGGPASGVVICGSGRAGLWALLAAPAADAVAADCDTLDAQDDHALLSQDLFCPGIRNLGGFEGAATLAAPHPLLLHNTGAKFPADALKQSYAALKESKRLRIERRALDDAAVSVWISSLK